jgi:hypothetical protein
MRAAREISPREIDREGICCYLLAGHLAGCLAVIWTILKLHPPPKVAHASVLQAPEREVSVVQRSVLRSAYFAQHAEGKGRAAVRFLVQAAESTGPLPG